MTPPSLGAGSEDRRGNAEGSGELQVRIRCCPSRTNVENELLQVLLAGENFRAPVRWSN